MSGAPALPRLQLRALSAPSPANPVMVCGLPGSGFVGKLAADYLVTTFKAEKFAEVYSSSFPPNVSIGDEGIAQRSRGELFHARTGQRADLIVFTADSQPSTSEGEYELAEAVLVEAKRLGVKAVFSLAAYVTGAFVKERRVFGAATSARAALALSANGVHLMREGGISGMNGLVVGLAGLMGMDGMSLLGETSGYLLYPAASHAVLGSLARILEMEVDMESIEESAKEAQQVFNQVQMMTEQGAEGARVPQEERKPGYIG